MSTPEKPARIPELDGTRGLAILSVLLANGFGIPLLWAGVDLFFVLSGLLITGILLRQRESGELSLVPFYLRRARRILPPYLLLLLISSLLFGLAWTQHWYWFAFFGTNVAAALHEVPHRSLQPLWSLGVEEQFYLVWPLVVLSVRPQTLIRICLALVVAAPILRGIATPWLENFFPIYYLTPFRMDLLAAGAILAWIYHWKRAWFTRLGYWPQVTLVAVAGVLVLLTIVDPGFRTSANSIRGNVVIFTCTNLICASLVTIALTGQGLICQLLRNAPLRYLGRISYSMYLIQQTALVLAEQVLPSKVPAFALAFVGIVLYGTICWYGFERRLLAHPRSA